MCLTCGCMDAHKDMGESNIRYETSKRAADENGRSVAETISIMERTEAKLILRSTPGVRVRGRPLTARPRMPVEPAAGPSRR